MVNHSRAQAKYVTRDVLGTMGESFHFAVSPAKQCGAGPYMFTSDPEMSAFCGAMSKCQVMTSNCGPGYNGWPKTFKYSPESTAKWTNPRCEDCDMPYEIPCGSVMAQAPGIL